MCAALLLAGCGPVEIESPEVSRSERAACEAFLGDLPDTLAGQDPVEIEPADALGAAYGDPAITLRCGVGVPEGFSAVAHCEVANGVGWYLPDEQLEDAGTEATLTAAGHSPRVELIVPADYRPAGVAAALAQLAAPVKEHLELVDECD